MLMQIYEQFYLQKKETVSQVVPNGMSWDRKEGKGDLRTACAGILSAIFCNYRDRHCFLAPITDFLRSFTLPFVTSTYKT